MLIKIFVILAVLLLSLSGCQQGDDLTIVDLTIDDSLIDESNIDNGENEMGEKLLTKAEFLKKVSEYENALEVTVEEFKDIDVNDFIVVRQLSETSFNWYALEGLPFRIIFDSYISGTEQRKIDPYLPKELRTADSTSRDYKRFKDKYLKSLGGAIKITGGSFSPERYWIEDGEKESNFEILRTKDIEDQIAHRWRFLEKPGKVKIPAGDGYTLNTFFISKNGKFFIVFYNGPFTEQTVKAFCDIDD
jgi:hypothetical protein